MSRWSPLTKRLALYGCAVPIAFGFCILPTVFQGEPDIGTLLSGAQLLTQVGAHDKAIVDCSKVLERDPGNVQAHLLLALARDRSGDLSMAAEAYREALKGDLTAEQEQSILIALADLCLRECEYRLAIAKCDEILSVHADSASAYCVRGLAQIELGLRDQAIESLSQAANLAPDDERIEGALSRFRDEYASLAP